MAAFRSWRELRRIPGTGPVDPRGRETVGAPTHNRFRERTRRLLPRHPRLVPRGLRGAHGRPGGGVGGGAGGPARARGRAHRLGQDSCGVPVGAGPAGVGRPPPDPRHRCRVLYVSPLKALAVDVQRNLRAPLTGIRQAAQRAGTPPPEITVGMRTGDTPADERRLFARTPPDVLVTTPESLFLLLTSAARESLRGVRTVILDEVHAVAGTKRGAHLALSLERLDALLDAPAQRIGLSATVRPLDEVATFLAGARPVEIVQPPAAKTIEVAVEVPVPDLAALDERPAPGSSDEEVIGSAAGTAQRPSIWPAVERRLLELVRQHRSTIVFANSRRLAERLTARLNELCRGGRAEAASWSARAERRRSAHRALSGRGGRPVRDRRRRAARRGEGAPRLDVSRAADRGGGGAQGRAAAVRRRDVQPRAGHRHGCGGPGGAGRGAAERRVRAAAGGPRRAPGGCRVPGRGLPQVPRRSRLVHASSPSG